MKNITFFIISFTFATNKVLSQITFKMNSNENISEDLIFLTLTDQSLQQCAEQCAERSKCQALRYRRGFHLCDLFTDYVPMPTKSDFITISRDDIQIPETFNVCDVNDDDCVKKECNPPATLANGRYLGNMNQIGSKKAILCDHGYVEVNRVRSMICQSDGNWNYTSTCEDVNECDIVDRCAVNEDCCNFPGGYRCIPFPSVASANESDFLDLAARTHIFTTSVNHATAVGECSAIGAKLVKIDQRWKKDYIVNIIKHCPIYQSKQYWIDGSNADAANYTSIDAWRFHDNTVMPMDTYFWKTNAPDNPDIEHCVRIMKGLRFNDYSCTAKFRYICEQ